MKRIASILVMGLLFGGPFASAEKIYIDTCQPLSATSLVNQVMLSENYGGHAELTITKTNAHGSVVQETDTADYYDDVTFYGYRSEKLDAAIEFWGKSVLFRFGSHTIPVTCERSEIEEGYYE